MNNWISVDDRLPGDVEDVLASDGMLCAVMYYDGTWEGSNIESTYDMASGYIDINTITHWQPLPSPPE